MVSTNAPHPLRQNRSSASSRQSSQISSRPSSTTWQACETVVRSRSKTRLIVSKLSAKPVWARYIATCLAKAARGAPRVGANNAAISSPKSRATQNATHWQVRSGVNGAGADEFSGGAGRTEELDWSIGGPSVAGKYAAL